MDIQLSQADLMQAVKDFICKKGLTQPVESIRFTATRSGQGVITDIRIADGNPEVPSQTGGSMFPDIKLQAEAEVIPAAEEYPNLVQPDPEDVEARQSPVEGEPEENNVALFVHNEDPQDDAVTDVEEEGPSLFPNR